MKEDKHTLTMTSGRLDIEEASFPVNSSVQTIGQCYRLPQPEVSASRETPRLTPRYLRTSIYRGPGSRRQHSPHPTMGGASDWLRPPACALFHPALNGGEACDWLRPTLCQWEGDKLPKGAYQQGNGYSTGVPLPEHLARVPSSRRGIQSRKFTGKGGHFSHT